MFLKEFFEKFDFEKSADDNKIMENYPACKELKVLMTFFSREEVQDIGGIVKDPRSGGSINLNPILNTR